MLYGQLIQALGDAIQAVLEFGEYNKKALGEEGLSEDSNVLRSDYFSQPLA